MDTPKIIRDFYKWSQVKVKEKRQCKAIAGGHYCYPSINDKQCRECWEQEQYGEN